MGSDYRGLGIKRLHCNFEFLIFNILPQLHEHTFFGEMVPYILFWSLEETTNEKKKKGKKGGK